MNLAHCHKFIWVRNKSNIILEEKKRGKYEEKKRKNIKKKRARKRETTALNLAAVSSSGFI